VADKMADSGQAKGVGARMGSLSDFGKLALSADSHAHPEIRV